MPLTVTIIAQNEGDRIAQAIGSVQFADEVLVLDSGSTDDTVSIARSMGARVVQVDWPGHVAQKNRAVALAAHDWILSIDADEQLSPALAASVAGVRERGPEAAGYRVARLSWWQGAPLRHGTWYPDRRVRLFDRRRARWAGRDPHDRVQVDGPVIDLSGDLHHHPFRSLDEQWSTLARYAETWSAAALADGVRARWWDVLLRPPLHFVKAILLKRGALDGVRGWIVAGMGAAYVMDKWARVWLGRR